MVGTRRLALLTSTGRLAELPKFEPKVKRGWLARYLMHASSADTGAVFEI